MYYPLHRYHHRRQTSAITYTYHPHIPYDLSYLTTKPTGTCISTLKATQYHRPHSHLTHNYPHQLSKIK